MHVATANDLADLVEQRIASGELRPGDRLPTIRSEATTWGLAANTVAAAYRRLAERGVVEGRGRLGTVVTDRPAIVPVAAAHVPAGVIDAATGNPDASLLPDLAGAVTRATAVASRARYGGPMLDSALADVSAEQFESDGVDPERLAVSSGAIDAVERLLAVRLRPGDLVAVEDPGYSAVHHVVRALGMKSIPVDTDVFGMQPDAVAAALAAGASAVVCSPRASNPIGAALSVGRAAELNQVFATRPDVLVIVDDHAGAISGAPYVPLAGGQRHWAVVRSAAKSLGPDLRVAVLAGDGDTIDRFSSRLQIGPGWVSHLLQRTVAELMLDADAQRCVERAAVAYTRRREWLHGLLAERGVGAVSRSGFHLWVPVADESAVALAMRDRGIAIRPGESFRIRSGPAVRVTAASLSDDEAETVADALADSVNRPHVARGV